MIVNKQRRQTHQRMKILEYLKSVTSHPNAEEVYHAVKNDLPMITLATVYRNLNLLADEGQILRFRINNVAHFDADTSRHQHCVCKKCGKIRDIFQKEISEYALKKLCSDFKADEVLIIFNGICKKCGGGK